MALSGKYGVVNIEKSSENEPIFTPHVHDELANAVNKVLQAQDKLVECLIEMRGLLLARDDGQTATELRNPVDDFR